MRMTPDQPQGQPIRALGIGPEPSLRAKFRLMSRVAIFAASLGGAALVHPIMAVAAEDEMTPLAQELEAGQSTEYALSRCAGFHFALITWAGPSRLGPALVEPAKQNIFNLIEQASMIRAQEGDQQATANVVVNVNAFSVAYLNHFTKVAPVLGGPLDRDPMWVGDSEICSAFIEEVK